MRENNWLVERMESLENHNTLALFAATINDLSIQPQMISGHVLTGGHGITFPERIMLCSPQSGFHRIEDRVSSLTLVDLEFFTDPSLSLNDPVTKKFPGQKPGFKRGQVCYYPASLQKVLPTISKPVFEAVLFFRIQKLSQQLRDGLLATLQKVIKPGAYFLGSGSFQSIKECQEIFQNSFDIEQVARLMNPDYFGYTYQKHVGFVLRKK